MPTVLVVDDDQLLRDTLKIILRAYDFEVCGEAADGEAALSLCCQHHPDVVLLDINMPGMDGLAALHAIRQEYPATRVIHDQRRGDPGTGERSHRQRSGRIHRQTVPCRSGAGRYRSGAGPEGRTRWLN